MRNNFLRIAAATVACAVSALTAHAISYTFTQITNNSGSNAVAGQLSVDVNAVAATGFSFKFTNNVGLPSNVSEIYATSTKTLGALTITESATVDFSAGGSPGSLPGSSGALSIRASANSPAPSNGLNQSTDWVTLTFLFNSTYSTYASLLSDLNSGNLQLGLHVTGIGNGFSESFVTTGAPNNNTPGVPDGGTTVSLLGGVLVGLYALKRKLS